MNQDARIAEISSVAAIGSAMDAILAMDQEMERAMFGEKVIKLYGKEDEVLHFVDDTLRSSLADPKYEELKRLIHLERFEDVKREYPAYIKDIQARSNEKRIKEGRPSIEGYGVYRETLPVRVSPGRWPTPGRIKREALLGLQTEVEGFFYRPSGKYGLPLATQVRAQQNLTFDPKFIDRGTKKINIKNNGFLGTLIGKAIEELEKKEKAQRSQIASTLAMAGNKATLAGYQTVLNEIRRQLEMLRQEADPSRKDSAVSQVNQHAETNNKKVLPFVRDKFLRAMVWKEYIDNPLKTVWERQVLGRKKFWEPSIRTLDIENKIYARLPGGAVLRRVNFLKDPRLGAMRLLFRGLGKIAKLLFRVVRSLVKKGIFGWLFQTAVPFLFSQFAAFAGWAWGMIAGFGAAAGKALLHFGGSLAGTLSTVFSAAGAAIAGLFAGVTVTTLAIAAAIVAAGIVLGVAVYFLAVNPIIDLFQQSTAGSYNPPYTTSIKSPYLQSLFVDAAKNACVPPELMLSIAQREAGGALGWADEQAVKYTQPGWQVGASTSDLQDGYCYNTCSNPDLGCIGKDVRGIMQFEQETFNGYKSQLQTLLGHEPDRCNAKDSIYAAALKIKANSGTGSSTCSGWSEDTIRTVAGRYCGGGCVDSPACGRDYCGDILRTYRNYLGFFGAGGNTVLLTSLANLLDAGYSDDFGYCARFVDKVMQNAGYTPIAQATAYDYFAAAKKMGYQTYEYNSVAPVPGDLVVWQNANTRDGRPGHIDIVWRVDSQSVELRGNANERFVAERLGNSFQAPPAVGGDELIIVGLIRLPVK